MMMMKSTQFNKLNFLYTIKQQLMLLYLVLYEGKGKVNINLL